MSHNNIITFSEEDYHQTTTSSDDALVVTLDIADQYVQRIVIDNGSSVDILHNHTLQRMLTGDETIKPCKEPPLYSFGNNSVPIKGTITLPVIFSITPYQNALMVKFYVVNEYSSYNTSEKWRICINYTDLNKACTKDHYPLPNIDQLIDATSGHILLNFMDIFSGYNQIKMVEEDIPKTSFITH